MKTPGTFGFLLLLVCVIESTSAQEPSPQKVTRSFTQPIEQSVVASAQMGVIKAVNVKEGDRVKAGDTLAIIGHGRLTESRRIAIARAESTAQLDATRSRMRMLQAQKETVEKLIGGGHVNRYEVEQKIDAFENALAEFRSAEDEQKLATLEVARIEAEIRDHLIVSPIDGFVTVIHKQLGEHVSTTEPQYATVVRLDRLKIRFYLDESTLDKIDIGSQVNVTIGKQAQLRTATVTFVSPVIDPDSGTGKVEVEIDNSDLSLRSGTICYWKTNRPGSVAASARRKRRTSPFLK